MGICISSFVIILRPKRPIFFSSCSELCILLKIYIDISFLIMSVLIHICVPLIQWFFPFPEICLKSKICCQLEYSSVVNFLPFTSVKIYLSWLPIPFKVIHISKYSKYNAFHDSTCIVEFYRHSKGFFLLNDYTPTPIT